MEVNSKLSLVIFVLFLLINDAIAIKCFQCNSAVQKDCSQDNLIDSKYIVECDDVQHKYMSELPATFCMKLYKKCESSYWHQGLIFINNVFNPQTIVTCRSHDLAVTESSYMTQWENVKSYSESARFPQSIVNVSLTTATDLLQCISN